MHGTRWMRAGSAHGSRWLATPHAMARAGTNGPAGPALHCTLLLARRAVQDLQVRCSPARQCAWPVLIIARRMVWRSSSRPSCPPRTTACCASCWSISLLLHVYTRAVYVRAERRRCIYTRTTARAYSFTAYRSPGLSLACFWQLACDVYVRAPPGCRSNPFANAYMRAER